MERNMETHLLHLLVLLVWSTRAFAIDIDNCPSMPIDNLICYNDYNQNITCEWDSTTLLSDHKDARCTIYTERTDSERSFYNSSCELKPVDTTNPAQRKCSLIFGMSYRFQTFHRLSIGVTCEPGKEILSSIKDYAPACHVKLNPPGKPTINITTVSWLPYITKHWILNDYQSELQWKRQDQSWSDSTVVKQVDNSAKLEEKELIQGEMYEARVRVQTVDSMCKGVWSDWGPTASWRSPVGEAKPLSGVVVGVVHIVIGGVALFALVLTVLLLKNNKTPWVYMVKRIRGPPLPNPAESFLQNSWLSPHFTSDSFHSFIKPVEILSVEVTSSVDFVVPCKREEKPLKKMDNYDSTNSSFSNPSYSELCTPPPVSSLTPGNLEPCAADSPYGPVGSQSEERNAGQDDDKMRGRDMEMFKLLLKSSSSSSVISEPLQVDSDYKKTEQIQAERLRLQSLDSGMCSCEEVSQESMEVDSINVSDSHDEELEDEEQKERVNVQKLAFEKLFGVKGGMFGKESIPVCSGYEQVQNLQADSPELASLDSGVSGGTGEHVSQEEITEGVDEPTESTRFLFPPPPSIALPCSLLPAPQLPLNVSSPGLSSALRPPLCHVLDRIAGMSSANLVEPSGDGYLPVRQEQC